MTPKRFRARLTTSGVALALLIGALAAPTGSLAATANIFLNGGVDPNNTTPTRAATPLTVTPGKVAGFYIAVKNADTANLPTFFMTASSLAAPYGAYWYSPADGIPHPCQTSPMRCDFGTFGAGATAVVVAAFTVPTSTGNLTSSKNCRPTDPNSMQRGFAVDSDATAWVCVDFKFASDQGNVPGKNKSRGDEFHWFDFVRADGDPKDTAAEFPYCDATAPDDCDPSLLTLSNETNLSNSPRNQNLQYTIVQAPQAAFNSNHGTSGIAVRDGGTFNVTCSSGSECETGVAANGGFLGETSEVSVNRNANNEPYFEDWILTTIGMLGVNTNQIDGVVHWYLDADGVSHEDVLGWCPSASGPDDSTPEEGCFWAVSAQGNTSIVYVWTHYNGSVRMF